MQLAAHGRVAPGYLSLYMFLGLSLFPLHECQNVLLWIGVPSATRLHLALGEGLFPGLQMVDIGRTVGDEALGNEELSENGSYMTWPERERRGTGNPGTHHQVPEQTGHRHLANGRHIDGSLLFHRGAVKVAVR